MSTPKVDWNLNNQSFVVLLERIISCSSLSKNPHKKFDKHFSSCLQIVDQDHLRVSIVSSLVTPNSLSDIIGFGRLTDIFSNQTLEVFAKINHQKLLFKRGITHNQSRFSSFGNISKQRLQSTLSDLNKCLERKCQDPSMKLVDLKSLALNDLMEIVKDVTGWRIGVNGFEYTIGDDSWQDITFLKCQFLNNKSIAGFDDDPEVSGVGHHSLLCHERSENIPKSNIQAYRMVAAKTNRRWQQLCFRKLALLVRDSKKDKIERKLKDPSHIDNCVFDHCLFESLDLERLIISNTTFDGCKFRNVKFDHVIFNNCKFINCSFSGESVSTHNGRNSVDHKCAMTWCSFIRCTLSNSTFSNIQMFENNYDMDCTTGLMNDTSDDSVFMPIYITHALSAPQKNKLHSTIIGSDDPPYAWHDHSAYQVLQGLFQGSDFPNLLAMMAIGDDTW